MSQDHIEEATSLPPSDDMMPEGLETYLLSESALARDWLSPEEDKAWEHLQEQGADMAEGSAYDLFEGLIGRLRSGGDGEWSQDCGKKFAEGMAEKRRQGRL